jgi:hypothetical protein
VARLRNEPEMWRIVLFGSFVVARVIAAASLIPLFCLALCGLRSLR